MCIRDSPDGDPTTRGPRALSVLLDPLSRFQAGFEGAFARFRQHYRDLLGLVLAHRTAFAAAFLSFCVASMLLVPFLGQDFFPSVDAGTLRLHVRARTGTRIEETAVLVDRIEGEIRREIPAKELKGCLLYTSRCV